MRKYNTYRSVLLLLMIFPFIGKGQVSTDSAISFFRKVCKTYSNVNYLSFKIRYTYANESYPAVVLDSLQGKIEMNKENCHMQLGTTETISNTNYNIILFKEDTLMYLSKPQSGTASFSRFSLIDSFFLKTKGLAVSMITHKGLIILTINFPAGMDYKKIEYSIDSATYYLRKVKYLVKTTDLLDPAAKAVADNGPMNDQWAIVESSFDNYATGQFNDTEFDDAKYFKKEGTEYKTTDDYRQYKIFKASPNL
jgi:hypothetical protein